MKILLLALAAAAVATSTSAQSDRPKGGEAETAGKIVKSADIAVDIAEARKLLTQIHEANKALFAAAGGYIAALQPETGGKSAKIDSAAEAQTLEIAGVKLEDFYTKAVKLRIKPDKRSLTLKGLRAGGRGLPALMDGIASRRVRLAQEQLTGGDAAYDAVEFKIDMAEKGEPSLLPSDIVKRLMDSARAVTKARAALDSAVNPRAAQSVEAPAPAAGVPAAPPGK